MKSMIQKFNWTDKPELKREFLLIGSIAIVLIVGFFKFKPYFSEQSKVITAAMQSDLTKPPQGFFNKTSLPKKESKGFSFDLFQSFRTSGGSRHVELGRSGPSIVERPLLDGLEVTFEGVLLGDVSTLAPENPVQIQLLRLIPEDHTASLDPTELEGGQIRGTISSNMSKKKLNFSFSELLNKAGRAYSITGYAVVQDTKTVGVDADYSSGLFTRLLGVALNRGIVAADQIAMAKVMDGMADNSATSKEIQRASIETNQQASMSLSTEATKEMRETQAELSLAHGTPIFVKIRSTNGVSR